MPVGRVQGDFDPPRGRVIDPAHGGASNDHFGHAWSVRKHALMPPTARPLRRYRGVQPGPVMPRTPWSPAPRHPPAPHHSMVSVDDQRL
jgi:hypothetical protein